MSQSNLHKAALAYAGQFGWPVFPCRTQDKRPLSKHGLKDATTDTQVIGLWWKNWPEANIGIPTGFATGFDVLDVDPRHGGDESLAELEIEHGKLPETVEALTGGGGRHILFKHRDGVHNSEGRRAGLDVRGEGGYVIVAPSLHKTGGTYEWELSSRPGEVDLGEWPEWLLDVLSTTNGHNKGPSPAVEGDIPEGRRNATLASLAGSMQHRGMSEAAILAALREENSRCKPPLPDTEVSRIVASISRYRPDEDGGNEITFSTSAAQNDIEWPKPKSLPDILPPVEPFRADLLPEAFRPWVEDTAERMQCPPDFSAAACMVALAAVVGRQVGIRPQQRDDWLVVPNLWGAIVGRPGVMKTPAIQEPLKAMEGLQARARQQYETEQKTHAANSLVAEERKKLDREKIKAALKKDEDTTQLALEAVKEAEEPVRRRYVVNDTTVEKLGEILSGNPRGLLLFRDELVGFLKSLDRDGREGDRSFYLESWNGNGHFTYDRIGRGTVEIEAACVSILGGIQPGPLSHYLRRIVRGGAEDDGLLQRFQLAVWPDVTQAWVNHDRTPDLKARQDAYAVFERLDNVDPATIGAKQEDGDLPYLRFTPDAQELFVEWRTELELRIRRDDEPPLIEAHLAKYRSLVPSLALLIHLADVGHGSVGATALRRACAWAEYLESHARRIYAPALLPAGAAAHALAKRLRAGELASGFTLRNIYMKGWHHLSSREEAQEAVDLLEDLDWIRGTQEKTGGRPTMRYDVSPRIEETV